MKKIYNFAATPPSIPSEILEEANAALLSYKNKGLSIVEIGYNSTEYDRLLKSTESSLRKLLNIPSNYKVLFMQGGAVAQYSAVPLNLLSEHRCADYVISGQHSKNASLEAKKYGDIAIAASSAGALPPFSTVPEMKRSDFRPDADYVYICFNNIIHGSKFHYVPDTGNIPLVADMSHFLLSEPIDVSKFALIYASSEGNIGPAGLTVVIIRDDIIGGARKDAPALLNYKLVFEERTSENSPPVWNLYLANLMFKWIEDNGGLEEIKRRGERKASLIYDYLDNQSYYTAPVSKKCRSMLHVVFVTGDASLDKKFVKEAKAEGLVNIIGHSSVGGMRASIYNAMPYEGVKKLVDFMKRFAQENPKLDA